jgi:hypothetical protein
MAHSLEEAIESVNKYLDKNSYFTCRKPKFQDPERYELNVYEHGEVAENENE